MMVKMAPPARNLKMTCFKKNKIAYFFQKLACGWICLGILAFCLEAVPALAGQQHATITQDTITVTAQKREESLQDVPISMDVLTGMALEDAGITQMTELTQFSPNVFSTPFLDNKSIVIRGISVHNLSLNPAVGLFVNDISYSHNRMQNPELLNIERVEVLRGPQGSLYGKNTEAGAISIITKQPGNDLEGKVFGEIGFFDAPHDEVPSYRVGGNFSGPVQTDKWFVGGAFQAKYSDGFRKNIYSGDETATEIDNLTGQATLRWTPKQEWDISLIADVSERDHGTAELRLDDGVYRSGRYEIRWDGDNEWTEENNSQVIRAKYKGRGFDLLSITSRSDYRAVIKNDLDMIPDGMFGNQHFIHDILSYSQELRICSSADIKKLTWVGGLFSSKDEIYSKSHTPAFLKKRDTEAENISYAVFGQLTYTLIDRLHLTAGARYERQELDAAQQNPYAVNPYYTSSNTNNEFLPKVSAAFDLTEAVMAYATVAEGFLSGGHDYSFGNNADDLYYGPEYTTNYEIGLKSTFFDNRLIVNAAVFHIDISDKQVVEWPAGSSFAERDVTNAGEASSDGFELELKMKPLNGLDIFAGFGYTNAEFTDWKTILKDGSTYDYDGKHLAYAPEYTFNVGAQYRSLNGLFLRADILGAAHYYTDNENANKVGGHQIVNLKVGYETERYDIVLWASNLFDEEYILSKHLHFNGTMVSDGEPRKVGVTLTYRF